MCRAKSEYEKVVKRKVTEKDPFFIVGKKKANLHLRGTVCGKIIVYAAANIIIEDDIFYAFQPDKFNRSNDYLGLISEKDVVIATPSVTGLGDLNICAAIFAKRKFCVSHFYEKTKATLQIYGSLSAGTITATEPRYVTRIIFDKRSENNRPPNFPLTDRYEIVEWDRQWKVKGVG